MADVAAGFARGIRRVLVTGGAGFIGSHLVDGLLALGVDVVCLDDLSSGRLANVHHQLDNASFRFVEADVADADAIASYFHGVDVVFHLAAAKNTLCMADPVHDMAVNAGGTLNVLHAALAAGVKRVVHASTGSVYGEPQRVPVTEDHPLAPVSYYGVSKLAGEKYALLFNRLHGLETVALRYFHVYGPRQNDGDTGGVVAIFCRRALEGREFVIFGDGHQTRSFTHVADVVSLTLRAAVERDMAGQAFNCASGLKVTVNDLAARIITLSGREVPVRYAGWRPGDIRHFDVDTALLKRFGATFARDFEQGLAETYEWSRIACRHDAGRASAGVTKNVTLSPTGRGI